MPITFRLKYQKAHWPSQSRVHRALLSQLKIEFRICAFISRIPNVIQTSKSSKTRDELGDGYDFSMNGSESNSQMKDLFTVRFSLRMNRKSLINEIRDKNLKFM